MEADDLTVHDERLADVLLDDTLDTGVFLDRLAEIVNPLADAGDTPPLDDLVARMLTRRLNVTILPDLERWPRRVANRIADMQAELRDFMSIESMQSPRWVNDELADANIGHELWKDIHRPDPV